MKKLMLIFFVFAIACSCKKPSNDPIPVPQKKAVAVVVNIINDSNRLAGKLIDVIYIRDSRVDTLNLTPGTYDYLSIFDYENVTLYSNQNMNIIVKVDDGNMYTKNIYAEYNSVKSVNFKVSELK